MVDSADELDVDFWLQESHKPDTLTAYAETLIKLGVNTVVEVGDTPTDSKETPVIISTLTSPSDDNDSPESDDAFIRAVAGVYENGIAISFEALFAGEVRRRISLPTYPFQRRRHWV